jgi:hypothetical protein
LHQKAGSEPALIFTNAAVGAAVAADGIGVQLSWLLFFTSRLLVHLIFTSLLLQLQLLFLVVVLLIVFFLIVVILLVVFFLIVVLLLIVFILLLLLLLILILLFVLLFLLLFVLLLVLLLVLLFVFLLFVFILFVLLFVPLLLLLPSRNRSLISHRLQLPVQVLRAAQEGMHRAVQVLLRVPSPLPPRIPAAAATAGQQRTQEPVKPRPPRL